MSWFQGDAPDVAVGVECFCPGTPHEGDTVWLRPELDVGGGFDVLQALRGSGEGVFEELGRAYLAVGITRWSFVDGDGQPVPCDREHIRRMRWNAATMEVAERASGLYGEQVIVPLVARASVSSPSGQTEEPTPPTTTG